MNGYASEEEEETEKIFHSHLNIFISTTVFISSHVTVNIPQPCWQFDLNTYTVYKHT